MGHLLAHCAQSSDSLDFTESWGRVPTIQVLLKVVRTSTAMGCWHQRDSMRLWAGIPGILSQSLGMASFSWGLLSPELHFWVSSTILPFTRTELPAPSCLLIAEQNSRFWCSSVKLLISSTTSEVRCVPMVVLLPNGREDDVWGTDILLY